MAVVNLPLSYETVLELVKQLPPDEQRELIEQLQNVEAPETTERDEWLARFDSLKHSYPVDPSVSLRREDWYGDEGR